MSWLPKRVNLDLKQASAIDFAMAQDGNFYVSGEAGARKLVVLAGSNDIQWRKIASGFGAMVATGRALGGGYRGRHGCHSRLPQ